GRIADLCRVRLRQICQRSAGISHRLRASLGGTEVDLRERNPCPTWSYRSNLYREHWLVLDRIGRGADDTDTCL
ncbi:MAG: hypothetical protein ACREX4_20600, partial [Gammaproteobacteria bacterium]